MSEKKKPSRTSDAERSKAPKPIDGAKGLERLKDFTRRIVDAGRVAKTRKD